MPSFWCSLCRVYTVKSATTVQRKQAGSIDPFKEESGELNIWNSTKEYSSYEKTRRWPKGFRSVCINPLCFLMFSLIKIKGQCRKTCQGNLMFIYMILLNLAFVKRETRKCLIFSFFLFPVLVNKLYLRMWGVHSPSICIDLWIILNLSDFCDVLRRRKLVTF
jgi:hypothetical protein